MKQSILLLSTYHVPPSTYREDCIDYTIATGSFTDIMFVPEEDCSEDPQWLINIFKLARLNDCDYVNLDSEGTIIDELEKFGWE